MKGKLHKTNSGWTVQHWEIVSHKEGVGVIMELPIHPKYEKYYFLDEDAEGGEVEFEIVKEYIDNHTNQVQAYAKLIKPSVGSKIDLANLNTDEDDGLTDDEWLIRERYKEIGSTAVDFARWISGKYTFGNILGKWYLHENTNKQYTEEELFELYKQTKL